MPANVRFARQAVEDLDQIGEHLSSTLGPRLAIQTVEKIKKRSKTLKSFPDRGHLTPEMERLGLFDYLEIHEGPYRIIYQIMDGGVIIHAILDGRRDVHSVLHERLIR
ncbi:MAG: type II toxin-antitoxin system RelE/ParE family toxin [Candidatus Marinimicrobia bacterium]|nr:type II toxin-antitoxin system RelE/ParE family toxin [Candidatus Neomarinimicrobiota bacterium]